MHSRNSDRSCHEEATRQGIKPSATAACSRVPLPAKTPSARLVSGGRCATSSAFAFAFGLTVLIRFLMHQHPVIDGARDHDRRAARASPLFFLLGLGACRLLAVLGEPAADASRGPLRPRRPQLARLLPRQHRPQGDRDPVRRHLVLLPARRRHARDADPRPAGQARACSSSRPSSTTASSRSTRRC